MAIRVCNSVLFYSAPIPYLAKSGGFFHLHFLLFQRIAFDDAPFFSSSRQLYPEVTVHA